MTGQTPSGVPFDEQAALEELERLQRAIEETRRRRGQTVDEFDSFLRSFAASPQTREAARQDASREKQSPVPEPKQQIEPPPPTTVETVAAESLPARRERRRRAWPAVVVAGAALSIVPGVMLLTRSRETPATSAEPAAAPARAVDTPAPTPAAAPPVTAPATTPAAGGAQTAALQGELITLRGVWVRIVADGQKVLERELKANDHIPLRAQKTIVIRAGDAGAVRVTIGGRDQGSLGRDGIAVSRTFTSH